MSEQSINLAEHKTYIKRIELINTTLTEATSSVSADLSQLSTVSAFNHILENGTALILLNIYIPGANIASANQNGAIKAYFGGSIIIPTDTNIFGKEATRQNPTIVYKLILNPTICTGFKYYIGTANGDGSGRFSFGQIDTFRKTQTEVDAIYNDFPAGTRISMELYYLEA